jgi:hypothetical protein
MDKKPTIDKGPPLPSRVDMFEQGVTPSTAKRKSQRKDALTEWFWKASTVGVDPGPLPAVVKALGERPHMNSLLTIEQARQIVSYVAKHDGHFMLVRVVPDSSSEWRPLCICNSRKHTIAVPECGTLLRSLVSELALLQVRSFEDCGAKYRRRKSLLRRLVLAAARELGNE